MSALLQWLLGRDEWTVDEPRPVLTSDADRARRERDAQRLRNLMTLVDEEIAAMKRRKADDEW